MRDMPTLACAIRIVCLGCLSTVTFFHFELPLLQFRIQVRAHDDKIPIPLGYFVFYKPFQILDMEDGVLETVSFYELQDFDNRISAFIDERKTLCEAILPLNNYTVHLYRIMNTPYKVDKPMIKDLEKDPFYISEDDISRENALLEHLDLY